MKYIIAIDREMEKLRFMKKKQKQELSTVAENSISYKLYQLRENLEQARPIHFMDMNYMKRQGMTVEGQNYALVYKW